MLRILGTLMRASIAEADSKVFDANAIRILEQQIRDAATALEFARRELACVMAHRASESRAAQALTTRIGELETGGGDAIATGDEALAAEVATVIAACEDEKRDRETATTRFDGEIAKLRRAAEAGRARLTELRRGHETARAQEALLRAGASGRRALAAGSGSLRDAETTLARIRDRHLSADDTAAALDELDRQSSGRDLDQRLAAAGHGANLATKPADILARLRQQAASRPPVSSQTHSPPMQPKAS